MRGVTWGYPYAEGISASGSRSSSDTDTGSAASHQATLAPHRAAGCRHRLCGRRDVACERGHCLLAGLRIGRQAATFYVTDDVVSPIDDRTATAVDQHRAINLDAERCRRRR